MKLEQAKQIAIEYVELNKSKYSKVEVVGSIRRNKSECKDIDIVAIPIIKTDKKILKEDFKGMKVEIYLTNETDYEVIKLIRTGSAEHNKKLCILAKQKGMSLKAGGEGLVNNDGVIDKTEKGILTVLLGKYIEPEERN